MLCHAMLGARPRRPFGNRAALRTGDPRRGAASHNLTRITPPPPRR
jgi:hypothetical protein